MKIKDKLIIWFLKREAGGWLQARRKHEMKMQYFLAQSAMHKQLMFDAIDIRAEKLAYIKVRENESNKNG